MERLVVAGTTLETQKHHTRGWWARGAVTQEIWHMEIWWAGFAVQVQVRVHADCDSQSGGFCTDLKAKSAHGHVSVKGTGL